MGSFKERVGSYRHDEQPMGAQWMTWTIPKELLGQGYKIKAVVTDDSGNVSEVKEFGPFEIISGAKPGGVVKVEGLTDGKWFWERKRPSPGI